MSTVPSLQRSKFFTHPSEPWRCVFLYVAGRGYRRGVYVSKKSKEFRERAARCQRLAQQTRNLSAKRELEEIARGYLSLAEYHNGETQTVQFVSRMPSLERGDGTHPAEPDATTAPPPPQQASEETPSDDHE